MNDAQAWRRAVPADLDAMLAVQDEVHALLPERREIFADKMLRFGEGCLVLTAAGSCVGYGIAHPWRLQDIPPLDTPLGVLPAASGCLFIHDVALLPEARGQGAGRAFVERMWGVAAAHALSGMALVSVYGTVPVWQTLGFETHALDVPASFGPTARYMTCGSDRFRKRVPDAG